MMPLSIRRLHTRLGELRLAEGLLNTYMDIRSGSYTLPEGDAALTRIVAKLGGTNSSQDDSSTDVAGDDVDDTEAPSDEAGAAGEESETSSEVEPTEDSESESGDKAASSEQNLESGSEEGTEAVRPENKETAVALVDMLPSDPLLAQLFLLQRRDTLNSQKNIGLGMRFGGLSLAVKDWALMGA